MTALAAHGQTLMQDMNTFSGDSGGYNLISFGAVGLQGSSDAQGALAVEGGLTIGGSWTIASQTGAGSNPSLYVSGSLSLPSATVYIDNGYASTPGLTASQWTWSSSAYTLTNKSNTSEVLSQVNSSGSHKSTSPITNPGPSGWTWSTVQSTYSTLSTDLGNAAATGTISVSSGNLVLTPPSGQTSGVVVFDLDASELGSGTYDGQSLSNITIDVPTGLNYVINVVNLGCDTTLFGSGIDFNAGTNDDQLLWNFEGSPSEVTIDSGGNFYGSILAPNTDIEDDTTIDGQVVAGSFTDTGVELHDDSFTPTQIMVPESHAFAWWALGLCGAGVLLRLRPVRRTASA
jgi:choice-of-anchor A domain-containing protein